MSAGAGFVFQASAVAIGGRALLITGPPGSGKSSLTLALVDRGAGLIGDDAVSLHRADADGDADANAGDRLIAAPPPQIAGLLELRGVGIVRLPVTDPAPVALLLELGGVAGERLPDTPLPRRDLGGIAVPVLRFDPGTIAPAERAEWALRLHGLRIGMASEPIPMPHRSIREPSA